MLIMVLGISTAIGRIMFGKIVGLGVLNRLHMHQLSMVVTGTAVMMLPMIRSFTGIILYVVIIGLVDGCYVVLLPVLTVSLMAGENSVTAWGFLIGTSSVTFTLGPPVAGKLMFKGCKIKRVIQNSFVILRNFQMFSELKKTYEKFAIVF